MFTWHVQKMAASSTHSDRTGKALDPKVTSNFIFLEKSTAFGFENYEIYNKLTTSSSTLVVSRRRGG
jgi:hypothetical protein